MEGKRQRGEQKERNTCKTTTHSTQNCHRLRRRRPNQNKAKTRELWRGRPLSRCAAKKAYVVSNPRSRRSEGLLLFFFFFLQFLLDQRVGRFVSVFRCLVGKQTDQGSSLLCYLLKSCVLWTMSCDFDLHS